MSNATSLRGPENVEQHVEICKAKDVGKKSQGQTQGIIRNSAIVGSSDKVNGLLVVEPLRLPFIDTTAYILI